MAHCTLDFLPAFIDTLKSLIEIKREFMHCDLKVMFLNLFNLLI
jgi:hypothetical protein